MFSHLNEKNQASMVNVGSKAVTHRTAHARAIIDLPEAITALLRKGEAVNRKGPVFDTAVLAGIMGAKKTSDLIPLCHPIGLDDCRIDIALEPEGHIVIDCYTEVHHKTGVEMEALTGASVAALTIYDMCKGLSHDIVIREIRLIQKTGGKSEYRAENA